MTESLSEAWRDGYDSWKLMGPDDELVNDEAADEDDDE